MMVNGQMILEEDYDENYEPTDNEILEYAASIGINVSTEQHLMFVAREGINAPLPENWRPCQTPTADVYYFNFATGESIWDHPCDEFYKKMVSDERDKAAQAPRGAQQAKKKGKPDGKKKKGGQQADSGNDLGPLTKAPGQKLNPLLPKAEPSMGGPQIHKSGGPLGPLKSADSLGGSGMRGSMGGSGQFRGSMNTTSASLPQTMGATSSMSLPLYSGDYDDEGGGRLGGTMDVAALGYEDSEADSDDPVVIKEVSESNDDSDDYVKDVDFGLDKNLSEKLLEFENMEPVLRGSLEKDIDGTLSLKSHESPRGAVMSPMLGEARGGRMSPMMSPMLSPQASLDLADIERKRKAEVAAAAADRRAQDQLLKDEEQRISSTNEAALEAMQEVMQREVEMAKLELLEDKDRRLRKLKDTMKKEADEEEMKMRAEKKDMINKLQSELTTGQEEELEELRRSHREAQGVKEAEIRTQMDLALLQLREEVKGLQKDETDKLEDEKRKALDKLASQVSTSVSTERSRLEEDQKVTLDTLRNKHKSEMDRQREEMERRHRDKMEEMKSQLEEEHRSSMSRLREDLGRLHEEEREKEEGELEAARKRQAAVDDLDRGLDEILGERKREVKDAHGKTLETLRKECEDEVAKVKKEARRALELERTRVEEDGRQEREAMTRRHERETEEMRKRLTIKKEALTDQLDDQEEEVKEAQADLERRGAHVEKSLKSLEVQEKKLEDRRRKLAEDRTALEVGHDDDLGSRVTSLGAAELARMREEKYQLLQEVQMEGHELERKREERKGLEGEVHKLKMARDSHNRKLTELRERVERKLGEFESLQDKFTEEALQHRSTTQGQQAHLPTSGHGMGDQAPGVKSRLTLDDLNTSHNQRAADSDNDEDDFFRFKTGEGSNRAIADHFDDDLDLMTTAVLGSDRSGVRASLRRENVTITRAKTFLAKQRRALKHRQSALTAAREELNKDQRRHNNGSATDHTDHMLEQVRGALDTERVHIDDLQAKVSSGSRLLGEKEIRLQRLEGMALGQEDEEGSDEGEGDGFSPFARPWSRVKVPNLDLSDDESSGVSSTDLSMDGLIHGYRPRPAPPSAVAPPGNDDLARALHKINSELARVLTYIDKDEKPGNTYLSGGHQHKGLPEGVQWSPQPPQAPHPPMAPPPKDYSTLVHTAEQSLERKWRKYFGDRRPPYTAAPYTPGPGGFNGTSHSVRSTDRLTSGGSILTTGLSDRPSPSVHTQLMEQKEWLKQHVNRGESSGPFSSSAHMTSHTGGHTQERTHQAWDTSSLRSTGRSEVRKDTPLVTPPSRFGGNVRLELDDHDEIRIRHF